MKALIIILLLVAFIDYALLIATRGCEDRETYMYEQWKKEHKNERDNQDCACGIGVSVLLSDDSQERGE